MSGLPDYSDRVVVVTGGARGLGAGIARRFAAAGAAVALADRDDAVTETAAGLADAGHNVIGIRCDVTLETDVEALYAAALERWGRVDVSIQNAGIITISRLEELSASDWERVLAVNTTGVFLCCRAAAAAMRRGGSGGAILNAASGQARKGFIFTPHYAASKFGVVGLTQSLAAELAPDAITVNAYCPGIVATDMWDYNDRAWGELLGDYQPGELIKEWIDGIPLGRAGTADDIANLLLFLGSEHAAYITGQTINIDGGMFMN